MEDKIQLTVLNYMGINLPLNICDALSTIIEGDIEDMDDDELARNIEDNYLASEVIEDIVYINTNLKNIIDGKSFRFIVLSDNLMDSFDVKSDHILEIKNGESFTIYRIEYDSELVVKKIETIL